MAAAVHHVEIWVPDLPRTRMSWSWMRYGWTLMFADRHPHAGGPQHYLAFLHDRDGYQLEVVAPRLMAAW